MTWSRRTRAASIQRFYDGNPAHLWGPPPVEAARRYVAARVAFAYLVVWMVLALVGLLLAERR